MANNKGKGGTVKPSKVVKLPVSSAKTKEKPLVQQEKTPATTVATPPEKAQNWSATVSITVPNTSHTQPFIETAVHMEKTTQNFTKTYEEMTAYSKEMTDAMQQCWQTWAKGAEEMQKIMTGLTQETYEKCMTTGKAMMGAKTLKDVMDLQTEFMKGSFDKLMSEGTKISEMCVKTANTAAEPIQSCTATVMNKYTKAA